MNEIVAFLINTGRTLSQMALYSPEHPSVKGTISESHRQLQKILEKEPELALGMNEGKLIVNGHVLEGVSDATARPFIQLLTKFDLHSLSFIPGISEAEMIPFFRLASRGEIRKTDKDVAASLANQNVHHIMVNQAKYAKIGEDETVGGKTDGESGRGKEGESVWNEIEGLSLNDLLKKLIGKVEPDPNEQEKIFKHAFGLIKSEIESTVKKVTEEFSREKTRLTNERERTEGVINTMADGVVVVDDHGNVLMMNPAAEAIYGVTLGESLGKPLLEGIRQEQMVTLAKDISMPTDRPMVKEVDIHAAAETQRTIRASSAAVQDPQGRIVGLVSVLSDVTKQKELSRLQNEFMANVTHELRTPLHAIKLAIGAILEGTAGQTSNEQQKMLNLAGRNLDRLGRLIDDLLDFSKIESGAMQIHPQTIDLTPLLQEAVSSLDTWAKGRGVSLVCENIKGIPAVFADNDRVLQIVVNLLSNAVKFTPTNGRVTLRAKTIMDGNREMVKVEVQDTGLGISPEDQKRIFEKFIQLKQNQKTDVKGTGLGLTICQALVDLHKGTLSVQSPPPSGGSGSVFSFTLPSEKAVVATPVKKVEEEAVRTVSTSLPVKKRSFWSRVVSKFKGPAVFFLLIAAGVSMVQARPRWGTVRRVISGDTIQLKDGSHVRYLGVEAPTPGNAHYPESLSANKRWVEGKEVRLQYGLQERDAKGVWLAYVYAGGEMVNEELVKEGMAIVASLQNEEEYLTDFLTAEQEAQQKKRGVWSDMQIDPYPVRKQRSTGFPWASLDEIKKGIKK
jgi:two-component system phosphate regulon sensor histidine kinase PhoR